MDKELLKKLYEMLQSPDEEMRKLAVNIFTNNSKDYIDYWILRSKFPGLMLQAPLCILFNEMYSIYDMEHVNERYGIIAKDWKEHRLEAGIRTKTGRTDILQRAAIIYGKKEQQLLIKKVKK